MSYFSLLSLDAVRSDLLSGEGADADLSTKIDRDSSEPAASIEKCLSHLILDRIIARIPPGDEENAHLQSCQHCQKNLKLLVAYQARTRIDVSRLLERSTFELARQQRNNSSGWSNLLLATKCWVLGCLRSWSNFDTGGLRSFVPSRWALGAALGCGLVFTTMVLETPLGEPLGEPLAGMWTAQAETGTGLSSFRTKGSRLNYFVQRGEEVFPGSKIQYFHPDDAIQFVLAAGPAAHFLLLGLADDGHQTVYFPYNGSKSVFLDGEEPWVLPHSLVLDDSGERETLVAFLSPQMIDVSELKKQLDEMDVQDRNVRLRSKAFESLGETYFLELSKEK